MHIHVLMLPIKFELIPIKIRFFMNFKSYSKSHVVHVLYCSACQLMKLMLFSSLSMLCGNPATTTKSDIQSDII